jgi:hypothetical protein
MPMPTEFRGEPRSPRFVALSGMHPIAMRVGFGQNDQTWFPATRRSMSARMATMHARNEFLLVHKRTMQTFYVVLQVDNAAMEVKNVTMEACNAAMEVQNVTMRACNAMLRVCYGIKKACYGVKRAYNATL